MNFLALEEIRRFRDQKDTALHQAAYKGDVSHIKQLLKDASLRNKINRRNRLGCSPLRLAATGGHTEVVSYLLEAGAEVNLIDIKTQTPLYVAVKKHHLGCVKQLLRAGADPNGAEQSLCTPIYVAAMDGWAEGMKELITHGADIDRSQVSIGTVIGTPLYISMVYRHLACFKMLLHAGADPDVQCKSRPGDLSPQGVAQSLFHAAVRHNTDPFYPQALFDFGASLFLRDDKGRLTYELETNNECKQFIRTLYDNPRTLLSQCRIKIRRCLGRSRLNTVSELPLPNKIKAYLHHQ